MNHTLTLLAIATLLATASHGQTTNIIFESALPLAYRANHHLVLDLKWTVHNHDARGGALVRMARSGEFKNEPVFQCLTAVSGFWAPLQGNASLMMSQHLAELTNPVPGQYAVTARIYAGAHGVQFRGGHNTTWLGVTLAAADFTDASVLEITTFGRHFSLDDARLRWAPTGTIFMTR